MMLVQLNPQIPIWHEAYGEGYALGWKDYSQDHHMLWICAFSETGEVWEIPNHEIRVQWNYSMERRKPNPHNPHKGSNAEEFFNAIDEVDN